MTDDKQHINAATPESLNQEAEQLRRRFVHHTRPKGPLSMEQAVTLHERIEGKDSNDDQ